MIDYQREIVVNPASGGNFAICCHPLTGKDKVLYIGSMPECRKILKETRPIIEKQVEEFYKSCRDNNLPVDVAAEILLQEIRKNSYI